LVGRCANVKAAEGPAVTETSKIAAILVADVVGFSRLADADKDRTLSLGQPWRGHHT
jgi:class 3 adenylate cyclase